MKDEPLTDTFNQLDQSETMDRRGSLRPARDFILNVVLVRSLYESNVGAASRAMSNMGAHRLILINPQCELTYAAQQAAASGQDGLTNKTIYTSWQEFYSYESEGIRIAFTARDGRGRKVMDLNLVYQHIAQQAPQMQKSADAADAADDSPVPVYLVFGPEDWGLSADDLELMHFCACIPTFGKNWSLNLAQAVMIALYELRRCWGGDRTVLDGQIRNRDTTAAKTPFPEESLQTWLEELGYDLSKPKMNVYKVMKRLMLQNTPTQKELGVLETVLQQSIRKLREWKKLTKNSQ